MPPKRSNYLEAFLFGQKSPVILIIANSEFFYAVIFYLTD